VLAQRAWRPVPADLVADRRNDDQRSARAAERHPRRRCQRRGRRTDRGRRRRSRMRRSGPRVHGVRRDIDDALGVPVPVVRDVPVPRQHLTAGRWRLAREPVGTRDAGRTVAALITGALCRRGRCRPKSGQRQTAGRHDCGRQLRDPVDDRSPSSGVPQRHRQWRQVKLPTLATDPKIDAPASGWLRRFWAETGHEKWRIERARCLPRG